jgi:hypothetical protein
MIKVRPVNLNIVSVLNILTFGQKSAIVWKNVRLHCMDRVFQAQGQEKTFLCKCTDLFIILSNRYSFRSIRC